jgi:Domain of unknown function (DUF397)
MPSNGLESGEWHKSSYSQVGECVEVAKLSRGVIGVRDTKNPGGPVLTYSAADWRTFLAGMRTARASDTG